MYGIAVSVAACLRGGTRVDVAWNLDPSLTPGFDAGDAAGVTPGGGKLGGLLGGALDSRLIELAAARPSSGQVVEVVLSEIEARQAGAEPGTVLRIMAAPADTLPAELWQHLVQRDPVAVTAELDSLPGEDNPAPGTADDHAEGVDARVPGSARVVSFSMAVAPAGEAGVVFDRSTVTTTWQPRPTLVVMGAGPMAEALASGGELVGWKVTQSPGPDAVIGLAETLSAIDGAVVVGHDIEGTGRVLQAALASRAGYIGSVGPQRVQQARSRWLAYRGISETERISAPAGLDIGARAPGEVAVAVIAEMIARQKASEAGRLASSR